MDIYYETLLQILYDRYTLYESIWEIVKYIVNSKISGLVSHGR